MRSMNFRSQKIKPTRRNVGSFKKWLVTSAAIMTAAFGAVACDDSGGNTNNPVNNDPINNNNNPVNNNNNNPVNSNNNTNLKCISPVKLATVKDEYVLEKMENGSCVDVTAYNTKGEVVGSAEACDNDASLTVGDYSITVKSDGELCSETSLYPVNGEENPCSVDFYSEVTDSTEVKAYYEGKFTYTLTGTFAPQPGSTFCEINISDDNAELVSSDEIEYAPVSVDATDMYVDLEEMNNNTYYVPIQVGNYTLIPLYYDRDNQFVRIGDGYVEIHFKILKNRDYIEKDAYLYMNGEETTEDIPVQVPGSAYSTDVFAGSLNSEVEVHLIDSEGNEFESHTIRYEGSGYFSTLDIFDRVKFILRELDETSDPEYVHGILNIFSYNYTQQPESSVTFDVPFNQDTEITIGSEKWTIKLNVVHEEYNDHYILRGWSIKKVQ